MTDSKIDSKTNEKDDAREQAAARKIQETWRGRQTIKGYMDSSTRWEDALVHSQMKVFTHLSQSKWSFEPLLSDAIVLGETGTPNGGHQLPNNSMEARCVPCV